MTLKKGFEMEENKENKVETPTTNTPENGGQEQKTFTQEELNTIVETRLAKAKKDMPSKEELKKYNEWKEAQKTEQEKMAEKETEHKKDNRVYEKDTADIKSIIRSISTLDNGEIETVDDIENTDNDNDYDEE